MTTLSKLAAAFVIGGVAGWVIENVLFFPRNSNVFGKHPVPFLPVYGFGAMAVVVAAPHLRKLPAIARAGIYAGGLSALELAACKVDRELGPASWDYGDKSCVDLPHAVAWGVLGLGADEVVSTLERRVRADQSTRSSNRISTSLRPDLLFGSRPQKRRS